jgi:phosphatidyl-myo-inositol dimannoside synthase
MILAATQIYGSHGGIPSYMQRLGEVFSAIARERSLPFSAVSLIDPEWEPHRHPNPVSYDAFLGSAGNRSRFLKELIGFTRKHRGETLVLGHVSLAPLGQALRCLGLVRSYVIVLHGVEAWKRLRMRELIAARNAPHIVATTRFTKERFATENGIRRERISIVPLAIEKSHLEDVSFEPPSRDPLRLLFVGRLWASERYKGLDELLEALSLLRHEGLRVSLQVVGTGDDLPRLVDKAAALGVAGLVTFSGALGSSALAAAYRDCDLFTLPSQGEGFGIVFLEAMSYGKPCLGAHSGGIPEVIDHGRDGYLVRYGNAADIASRIRELSQDRKLLSVFARKAYDKVREKYLFTNMLANWRDLACAQAWA